MREKPPLQIFCQNFLSNFILTIYFTWTEKKGRKISESWRIERLKKTKDQKKKKEEKFRQNICSLQIFSNFFFSPGELELGKIGEGGGGGGMNNHLRKVLSCLGPQINYKFYLLIDTKLFIYLFNLTPLIAWYLNKKMANTRLFYEGTFCNLAKRRTSKANWKIVSCSQ